MNVSNVTDIRNVFDGATHYNREVRRWNVRDLTEIDGIRPSGRSCHWEIC